MDRLLKQREKTKKQHDKIYADLEKQRVRIKEMKVPPIPVAKVAKEKAPAVARDPNRLIPLFQRILQDMSVPSQRKVFTEAKN